MEVFNTPANYPQIYQIELTEKCNFNCPMCIGDQIKNKKDAGKELIDKIVDSGYLRNTMYTEFQFSGEPTLSPILDYAIQKVKSAGTMVGLSTNLSTINKEGMIQTLNELDCLTISVDVFNYEAYEKSRFPAKFDNFLDNLYVALTHLDKPLIQLQLLKTSWTEDVYDDAKEALSIWLKFLHFDRDNVIVREVEDCFVGYHNNGDLPINNEMCLNPFITVSIKADGTVVPCCFDFLKDLPLGNIFKEDLLKIWQGLSYNEEIGSYSDNALVFLREAHRLQEGLPNKCKECYARSPIIFMNNEIIPTIVRDKLRR